MMRDQELRHVPYTCEVIPVQLRSREWRAGRSARARATCLMAPSFNRFPEKEREERVCCPCRAWQRGET